MVPALAFVATAIGSLFAESLLVRWTQRRTPQLGAWTVALALFALASGALALGTTRGWDRPTFRVFFLCGAVLDVPWLALGTVALLLERDVARRTKAVLIFFSGLAAGVVLSAPMHDVHGTKIPVGKHVFETFPRVLAGVGSGFGATVIVLGALWSLQRFARDPSVAGRGRLAAANALIAAGTLVLSAGGLVQGVVGHDEAFALTLATGIAVLYAGFLVAESARAQLAT